MTAYMLIEITVEDAALYAEYMQRIAETVSRYGGRYLVRGGKVTPLTGAWHSELIILLEFPSEEAMYRWNLSIHGTLNHLLLGDRAWMERLVGRPVTMRSPDQELTYGKRREILGWAVLAHLFNHQTHHRGQVTTLLKQLGKDPGVTDLPWMPWFD